MRLGEGHDLAQNDNIVGLNSSMPACLLLSVSDFVVASQHLVRIGLMGHVGRFASVDGVRYARNTRVICRTARGLETGQVLSSSEANGHQHDGDLIRKLSVQDELLLTRLEKHRDEAFQACAQLIAERQMPVALVDVEHLFDGQSLYFYFLGDVTPELEAITGDLAATYETKVRFQQFAETLVAGCGPGCGTEEAAGQGCSTGTCSSCAVAQACGSRGS